jgi:hypothetical protein
MLSDLIRPECKEASDFFSLSFSSFSNDVAAKTIMSPLPHQPTTQPRHGRKAPTGFSWYIVAVDFSKPHLVDSHVFSACFDDTVLPFLFHSSVTITLSGGLPDILQWRLVGHSLYQVRF